MVAINKEKENKLSYARLIELLQYNEDSGIFIRKLTKGGQKAGSIAGSLDKTTGYLKISIDGTSYRAHRLAWFYKYKVWPTDQVDHIDNNRSNNRIINLRCVDNRNNQQNSTNNSIYGHNISKIGDKFSVDIKGKTIGRHYLGLYSTNLLAIKVRDYVLDLIELNESIPSKEELKERFKDE